MSYLMRKVLAVVPQEVGAALRLGQEATLVFRPGPGSGWHAWLETAEGRWPVGPKDRPLGVMAEALGWQHRYEDVDGDVLWST